SVGGVCISVRNAQASAKISEYTVVIDAGHGGIDGGVVGSQGVKESDINLKMAGILQKELDSRGFGVVMTRTTQDALNNIKRLDMQARKDIIVKASPIAVISLHVNKFSDPSRRGAQVFYDDTGIGKDFAVRMQERINQKINAKYSGRDDYEAIAGDLFITKCVKVPSIIIECGFISNPEDEKLLLSQDYCKDLCKNIADVLNESLSV
nr:N-acetylmuramoyl-L-alanine amidase [Clostridia bacterium]